MSFILYVKMDGLCDNPGVNGYFKLKTDPGRLSVEVMSGLLSGVSRWCLEL